MNKHRENARFTPKKWTEDEIKFLKNNAEKMDSNEIAKSLSRTRASVVDKARRLNIKILKNKKIAGKPTFWDDVQLGILREKFGVVSDSELADELGKTPSSIRNKAYSLGIKKFKKSDRDGYCFCKNCRKELPRIYQYFPPDETCKDGLRSVCRNCSGVNRGYLKDDFTIPVILKKDEEEEFIVRYPHYTTEELLELFYPKWSGKGITDKANSIRKINNIELYKTDETKARAIKSQSLKVSLAMTNRIVSVETREKISAYWKEYYKTNTSKMLGSKRSAETKRKMSEYSKSIGKWSGNSNPRVSNPLKGELNPRWLGGVTDLYAELRTQILDWKKKSMENCEYKCVITGGAFRGIHHLHPFKNIFDETMKNLNMDIRPTVGDYSKEEFQLIIDEVVRLHEVYPLGVCLSREVHQLFHKTYGYFNNTPEQFYEFKENYRN